jgi:poly(3-hydroxybutyrate) depolymerase
MFVLQVSDLDANVFMNPGKGGQLGEVERAMKIYRSAIAYLNANGLIDPRRVGIIGFSHTCFFVKWALTHDRDLFAAASVSEGADGSYMQYMLDLPSSVLANSLYGGPPFGDNLKTWVELSPIFHVDRVRAPLLLVVLHNEQALDEWEWLDGLRDLRKPVEMIVLDGRADDGHILQEPWSVAVASGRNVEWFDFWLNGREDSDIQKAAQYRRWEQLCGLQKEEDASRKAVCPSTRSTRLRAGGGHQPSGLGVFIHPTTGSS